MHPVNEHGQFELKTAEIIKHDYLSGKAYIFLNNIP
jgi:hypothetical protein